MTFNYRKYSMLGGVATAALLAATSAWAQATPAPGAAPAAAADNQIGEVVVTGSRIARTGFTAPSPTTVIGVEQIQARGAVNVADVLNEAPAFRSTRTAQGSSIGGGFGANNLDLRGLGTVRTLVLVNGRRHIGSSATGEVDINTIPSGLVERTEVVTGGASAAYGSDAVAGVVNIILKNKLQGVQGNVSYGTSDKADDNSYNVNLAAGTSFAGGRGHIMIGGEYDMSNGLPSQQYARDWSAKLWQTLSGLPATRPAGVPASIVAPNFQYSTMTAGGYITNAGPVLSGQTFLPNGTTVKFNQGPYVAGANEIGGDNPNLSFVTDLPLVPPLERKTALAHMEFEITPKINAFAEFGFANVDQRTRSAGHLGVQDPGPLTIKNDNAFLPAAIKTQLTAAGLTQFNLTRYDSEIGRYAVHNQRDTRRAVFGLNGDLGGGWSWDTYYQYGYSKSKAELLNQVTNPNYLSAIDAVVGANGTIVCRAQLAGADPGCVPFNVFGAGSPSAAAIAYVTRDIYTITYNRQQVASANLRGEPFSVWAGPVSLAVGAEWRQDTYKVKSDPYQNAKTLGFGNAQPVPSQQINYNFNGKIFTIPNSPYNASTPGGIGYNVKEIYAETVVPLAKDTGFIHSIDLNGAARRTDYSLSGAVTTWKFGATFEDSSRQLRLRATRSRDIRAPNLNETFATSSVGITTINDTIRGSGSVLARTITSGSTSLSPEIADTYTVGGVISPNFLSGFRASLDYYNINIAGVISTLPAQTIVDRCGAGATDLCKLIIRDGAGAGGGTITDVLVSNLNLNALKTSGFDIEADYRVPISKVNLPGEFDLRFLATHVAHLITVDSAGRTDRAGQLQGANQAASGTPKWVLNLAGNYSIGRFNTNITARYIGRTFYDVTKQGPGNEIAALAPYNAAAPNSINRNLNPGVLYLDLGVQYTVVDQGSRKLVVYGVMNNVTDRAPPGAAGANVTNTSFYDLIGRFMRVGVRFNY